MTSVTAPPAAPSPAADPTDLHLTDGSRIGVVGGGPAGSFFSYFVLELAGRAGIDVTVDVYEPRDFSKPAPTGCNMCGGIVSESLIQHLAAEGITFPPGVVQRGIESYTLHTHEGSVRIDTPLQEKRIGAVYRGPGPRDVQEIKWASFDAHLQVLSIAKGANLIQKRVESVTVDGGRPQITARGEEPVPYDLVVVAAGVNSAVHKLIQDLDIGYAPPPSTKTFIREYCLGAETVAKTVGNTMHVFLLNLPRLEFGAIIPKGDYVSVCMLGENIDKDLIAAFLDSPEVRARLPESLDVHRGSCQCSPKISVGAAAEPFADRIAFIGDSGVTRLYKDGIGAAYRTAKAAASAAVFHGISAAAFKEHYWPACRTIDTDNDYGKFTFNVTRVLQKRGFARSGILDLVAREQKLPGEQRRLSGALWDLFTGSASYRDVFTRMLHPGLWGRLGLAMTSALIRGGPKQGDA